MWWQARKWVQRIRALIAILFFNFSWSPICWSCWMIDPSCSALAVAISASHNLMSMSLCAWAFIFSIAFFQFLKGFEIHVPPVLWREISLSLQTLQKAPQKFSSDVSQLKLSSHFLLYFQLLVTDRYFFLHFSWTVNRFFTGLAPSTQYQIDCCRFNPHYCLTRHLTLKSLHHRRKSKYPFWEEIRL